MFIPSALIHTLYLATRAYVPGAQPVPPFVRLRSGRPLSPHHPLHAQNLKTTDQVPLRRVPIVGLAECFALPVAIVEVCRVQPEAYSRGLGRYDVHFYTGTDQEDEFDSHPSTSPPPKGSGSVQGTPLPTLHSRGKLTGITSSRPTSAVQRRVTHPPASRCLTCPTNFTVGDLSPFPRGASRSLCAPGSTNGTTSTQGSHILVTSPRAGRHSPTSSAPLLVSAGKVAAGPIALPRPPEGRHMDGKQQQENFMRGTSRSFSEPRRDPHPVILAFQPECKPLGPLHARVTTTCRPRWRTR
jgi:hypothetical protein